MPKRYSKKSKKLSKKLSKKRSKKRSRRRSRVKSGGMLGQMSREDEIQSLLEQQKITNLKIEKLRRDKQRARLGAAAPEALLERGAAAVASVPSAFMEKVASLPADIPGLRQSIMDSAKVGFNEAAKEGQRGFNNMKINVTEKLAEFLMGSSTLAPPFTPEERLYILDIFNKGIEDSEQQNVILGDSPLVKMGTDAVNNVNAAIQKRRRGRRLTANARAQRKQREAREAMAQQALENL